MPRVKKLKLATTAQNKAKRKKYYSSKNKPKQHGLLSKGYKKHKPRKF